MKLTDPRLWASKNLDDFLFRLHFDENDNAPREHVPYSVASFITPNPARIWGPDISHWDGHVDLSITKAHGAKFVIIKGMDGTIPTKYFTQNLQSAQTSALLSSGYQWLYPDNKVSCKNQARAFNELLKNAGCTLPPVVDFEWTKYAGVTANPTFADLDKWVDEFNSLFGTKPILYSAAGYMNLFGPIPKALREKFSGIWVASYGGTKPIFPMGISAWDIWQFSAFGDALTLCPGNQNKKELDLNYMQESFYNKYLPTTVQGDGMIYKGTTKMIAKVWNTIGGSQIKELQPNVSITGDLVSGEYMHLVSPVAGWTKKLWLNYSVVTDVPPPPPPPVDEYILHVKDGISRKFIPE